MSISSTRNTIANLMGNIADLEKSDAQEAKKEADYISKASTALDAARRTKDPNTLSSRMKDHERATKDAADIRGKRADISGRIASKQKDLARYQDQLRREEESERRKSDEDQKRSLREQEARDRRAKDEQSRMSQAQRRLQQEREEHERRITQEIASRAAISASPSVSVPQISETAATYDFFVSHASEDKEEFVEGLANELKSRGATVWYDNFTLKIGDSLRRKIDEGLRSSRFGIVVLSGSFFKKEWPQRELDGLVALEGGAEKKILPIWHRVSKDDVARYSPTLADRIALNTSIKTTAEIATELMDILPKKRTS